MSQITCNLLCKYEVLKFKNHSIGIIESYNKKKSQMKFSTSIFVIASLMICSTLNARIRNPFETHQLLNHQVLSSNFLNNYRTNKSAKFRASAKSLNKGDKIRVKITKSFRIKNIDSNIFIVRPIVRKLRLRLKELAGKRNNGQESSFVLGLVN